MFEVNLLANIKEFQDRISRAAHKQLPFATGQALTALAKDVTDAEKANMAAQLDRPRPFSQAAVRAIPARKGTNAAKVVMQDITARYLEPYEFGGRNVLNSKALLKPIGATKELDRFGNLPRRLLQQLKARGDVFIGTVKTKRGPVSGVWQRTVEEGAAVPVQRKTRVGKTTKGTNTSGRLKLLIKFDDAHEAKQRLGWFDVARVTVTKNFNRRMGAALAKAIATARD